MPLTLYLVYMSVFERDLVIVDIETNGGSSMHSGRVIEVAALRVNGGQVVQTFTSLVNPGRPLPRFITELTGLTTADVAQAPDFSDIAVALADICKDAIFVAHNVRFDYAFIKQEFARIGMTFQPQLLCSVRLSRALYPGVKGHSLQKIIERHAIAVDARHRAYDDAKAVYDFLNIINAEHPEEAVATALKAQLKRQAIPRHLAEKTIQELPEGPGVYVFEDERGSPIYIGKSINIKKRVLSHFARDHAETSEFKLAQHVRGIHAHRTHGELGALILESDLIKSEMPLYNKKLRRSNKMLVARVVPNGEGYHEIQLQDVSIIRPEELDNILAVFPSRGRAKQTLELVRDTFQLCPKLLGLENARTACFLSQLGKCRGACIGRESPEQYNKRLMMAFDTLRLRAWPYQSPVLIEECDPTLGGSSALVIDQWRIVAHIEQGEHMSPHVTRYDKAFELDTYKILQSYLKHHATQLKMKFLTPSQFDSLLGQA